MARKPIATKAAGFALLARELERDSLASPDQYHSPALQGVLPAMCLLLNDLVMNLDVRRAMKERIREAMSDAPGSTLWASTARREDQYEDQYTPRIIAAQWFALEAAEEGV